MNAAPASAGTMRLYADKVARRLARYAFRKPMAMHNNGPLVSFTFDDVPDSAYALGAPMLETAGARGTFYVSGGLAGSTQPDWRLMSAADCLDLHRRGHEIACHTYSHRAAQTLDAIETNAEIVRNRMFFKSISRDIVPENFAFPYGSVSPRSKRQMQRYFHSCRGVTGGINVERVDLALLKAVPLSDNRTDYAAASRLIDDTVRQNGWLIFYTHDVAASPTPFGCTPGLLEHAIAAAHEAGCAVLSVRDALRRVAG